MKKILILTCIFLTVLALFAQPGSFEDRLRTEVYIPYGEQPLQIQVRDTDNIELSYIYYDPTTARVIVRGSLDIGLKKLTDIMKQQAEMNKEIRQAAAGIRIWLNSSGTVRRRDSLTAAIRVYDSVVNKFGLPY